MHAKTITGPLLGLTAAWLALALAGCGSAREGEPGTAAAVGRHSNTSIAPPQARDLIAGDSTVLVLDVRDSVEWNGDLGHIARARLIPLSQLAGRVGEIEAWRGRTVITVGRDDVRGHHAAELLASRGFKDARSLRGGMQAWRAAGY